MKLSTIFFVIAFLQIMEKGYSQTISLNLNKDKMSVRELLKEIERQTELSFIFSDDISSLNNEVSLTVQNRNIQDVLKQLLRDTDLDYQILNDKLIVIAPKEILQVINVSGRVIDEAGEPLLGVTVTIKGLQQGTATDADGAFSLQVPDENAKLVFSYIGFITQDINIGNRRSITVTLSESTHQIDEIVVVGYGSVKKVNLTGSVGIISEKILSNRATTTLAQMVEGASPNLRISMTSRGGEPGAGSNWNIRGLGTIDSNNSSSPLILIDGVESSSQLIDPETIESISILKDAAASAIYGSRAPFGVILITTKKGKKNQPARITYNNNFYFAKPLNVPDMYDSEIYAEAFNWTQVSLGAGQIFSDSQVERIRGYIAGTYKNEYDLSNPPNSLWRGRWEGNANYNWAQMYYDNNGFTHRHNVNVEGGGENTQFFFSGGYYDQQGLHSWGNDGYKRLNLTSNVTTQITHWIKAGVNMKYSRSVTDRPVSLSGQTWDWIHTQYFIQFPTAPMYNEDGTYAQPLMNGLIGAGRDLVTNNELVLSLNGEIEPIKGWRTNVSYSYMLDVGTENQNPKPIWVNIPNGTLGNIGNGVSSTIEDMWNNFANKFTIMTSYERLLGKHYLNVLAGYERELRQYRTLYSSKAELLNENVVAIRNAVGIITLDDRISHWATEGYFGRLNYNFKEKYLLEINFRYDGSSRFPKHSRWGFFPSGSAGYVISKEDFWEPLKQSINFFKLRASYGSLGNCNVANYLYLNIIPITINYDRIMDGNTRPMTANRPGITSDNLTWETVTALNIGLDAYFLNNRLSATIEWYNRITSAMMGPAQDLPATLGTNAPQENNAKMSTKGIEILLNWRDRIGSGFLYNVGITLGDNKSTILEYKNEDGRFETWYKGKVNGEIWGYVTDRIIQSQADLDNMPNQSYIRGTWRLGDMIYRDLNGDGKIDQGQSTLDDPGDRKIIGNSSPRYNYGITLGMQWKVFDFSMFWQGIGKCDYVPNIEDYRYFGLTPAGGGNLGNNSGLFKNGPGLDFWRPADYNYGPRLGPNTNSWFTRGYFTDEGYKNFQTQTRYLLDASYFRLKNLQFSYIVPQHISQKIFVDRARIYFSGENLVTFTKLAKTLEPESALLSLYPTYPVSRTLSFGVNITF